MRNLILFMLFWNCISKPFSILHTQIPTGTHTDSNVHTCTHRYIHGCTHWQIHTHVHHTGAHMYTHAQVHTCIYTHRYSHLHTHIGTHTQTYTWRAEKEILTWALWPCGYILRKLTSSSPYNYNIKTILLQIQIKKLAQVFMLVFFEQLMCDGSEVSHGWCRCWVIATHLECLSVNANFKYSVIPRCMPIT